MEEKITIIEGPPPVFETAGDAWVHGLSESSILTNMSFTRLRTFNGPALVERCHRAWRSKQNIPLEYRSEDGLIQQVPIVAARTLDTEDGSVLLLWVRLPEDEYEIDVDSADDEDDLTP